MVIVIKRREYQYEKDGYKTTRKRVTETRFYKELKALRIEGTPRLR